MENGHNEAVRLLKRTKQAELDQKRYELELELQIIRERIEREFLESKEGEEDRHRVAIADARMASCREEVEAKKLYEEHQERIRNQPRELAQIPSSPPTQPSTPQVFQQANVTNEEGGRTPGEQQSERSLELLCSHPYFDGSDYLYTLCRESGMSEDELDALGARIHGLARAGILVIKPREGRYQRFEETWVQEIYDHFPGKEIFPLLKDQELVYTALKNMFITRMGVEARALQLNDGDAGNIPNEFELRRASFEKEGEPAEEWTLRNDWDTYRFIFNGPFMMLKENTQLSSAQEHVSQWDIRPSDIKSLIYNPRSWTIKAEYHRKDSIMIQFDNGPCYDAFMKIVKTGWGVESGIVKILEEGLNLRFRKNYWLP